MPLRNVKWLSPLWMGLPSRLAFILILALLPVFAFVVNRSLNDQAKTLSVADNNLRSVAQLSALGAGRTLEGSQQLLGGISSGPSLKGSGMTALCENFLFNTSQTYPKYTRLAFLDVQGSVLCDSLPVTAVENFADRDFFKLAMARLAFSIGEYQIERKTGRAAIYVSMPVFDNQKALKGVAVAALDLNQLPFNLAEGVPANVKVSITDRSGTILGGDKSHGGLVGSKFTDMALFSAMQKLPTGVTQAKDASGVERLYAVASVDGGSQPGLFVIASTEREAVTGPAQRELIVLLLLFGFWAFLGLAAAQWLGHKMLVKPTRRLLSDINQLAGRSSTDALEPNKADDEIGALSSAFRRLAGILDSRRTEIETTMAELRATRDRLLSAQRIGKIGNWHFEVQNTQFWWSDQTYVIYEQDPESFIPTASNVAERIVPEDRQRCKEARHNFSAGNSQLDLEYRIVTGKGRVRWVRDLGEKQVDSHGQEFFSGAVQDVTDRVRNERMLEAEARALKVLSLGLPLKAVLEEVLLGLETILPGAVAAVNLLSPDGIHFNDCIGPSLPLAFNQAFNGLPIGPCAGSCGTAAYLREPVIVSDIASDPLWADYQELAQAHGLCACWSLPVQDPAGKVMATVAVYYRKTHAPDPEDLALVGGAASVIGIAIERDLKDAALAASEQRLRNTFAGATIGMAVTTVDGRYVEVNAAYCQMLGYAAEELHGMDFNNYVHPDDRGKYRNQFLELQEGKRESFVAERRYLVKGARLAWVRSSVSVVRDASSTVTYVIGISEDITVQREAEHALFQVQRMLSMASRISRQGAWQVDLADRQLTWSSEAYAIHELPPVLTPTVDGAISTCAPEFRDALRQLFENCASQGVPFDAELQILTGKERRIWVRVLGEAVKDSSGTICQVQGAVQDIDLQKQTELRERTLASRLATTLESISDAFFLLDHDWNFVFVNGQAVRTLSGGHQDLVGKNLWQEYPQILGTLAEETYRSAVADRQTKSFDWFSRIWNRWLEFRVYPTDEGLGVYFQDITAKREAAEELQLLKKAVSHLNDIVVITAATGTDVAQPNIVFVNEAFERQTGFSRDESIGKSPSMLHGPKTQPDTLTRIRQARQKKESVRAELIKYTKTGEEYWVEFEAVPIINPQGELTHYVAIERNITERKQVEDKILQLNTELEDRVKRRTAQLEAANAELEAFSYSVSHDLRSPLNTINGFGELLLKSNKDNLDQKGQHYLSRIRAGAKNMGELIDGLLLLAKLSRDPLKLETVDLSTIARRVEQECREQEPERQVQIQVQGELKVRGDAVLLLVAIQNLLGNAWKYSAKKEHAKIDVGSEAGADGQTIYFVKDNGAGFDMAYADKLFGVFQRLHSPSEFSGTGVGLANVKRVIERHGGRIWAEARVDEGASFYFTLKDDRAADS